MPVIKTSHLKLYQGKATKRDVLVLYGHGDIGEGDTRTYTVDGCRLYFYVDEGKICNVLDRQLRAEIRNARAVPAFDIGDDESVPDYNIYKYRGRDGHEQGKHYSDQYYLDVAKACNVDIIRVRHRHNNKSKRLSEIVAYAKELGYASMYCLHCRFRKKSFAGELGSGKKQKNYRDERVSRPRFRA